MTGRGPIKVEVKDLRNYPKNAIGLIISKEGIFGTGFLIGPNIVLTSGHNCFSWKHGLELT